MSQHIHTMMDKAVGMLSYNYGANHPLTVAAKTHDIDGFFAAGRSFTEDQSVGVCRIVDAINFSR